MNQHVTQAPMPYSRISGRISTPAPRVGRYGILDRNDVSAWRKVSGAFEDMGLTLIRQLGMGEFGRVYEAINRGNPHIPQRVAVKVDRIEKRQKKNAILAAEETMKIGRDLGRSPHVIRIYDAGKLSGKKYTYHVIQLVDGDTLDNLVGITGREHASIHRPRQARQSPQAVRQEYLRAMDGSAGEGWRRRRRALPFLDPLTLSQLLDVFTSILLWLEEIHRLGYAVNDLKNGNLMISRRGQLKGIDLDAYARVFSTMDKLPDFFFLAPSLLLIILHGTTKSQPTPAALEKMVKSRDVLRSTLQAIWPFGDLAEISRGRVATEDAIDMVANLISRSRDLTYAKHPDVFSEDINHFIELKRTIFVQEIVLD